MGRPLNKKYFGNRNVGSASTTADDGLGGSRVASVTLGTLGSYTVRPTVTFSAPDLAGPGAVTATGTVTSEVESVTTIGGTMTGYTVGQLLTVDGTDAVLRVASIGGTGGDDVVSFDFTGGSRGTFTTLPSGAQATTSNGAGAGCTVVLAFRAKAVVITEPGSGYSTAADAAPSFTQSVTGTSVLEVDSGVQGAVGNQENAIRCNAFVTGGSRKIGDIIKQVSTDRYKVETADGEMICQLVTDGVANAAGEMDITAVDSGGKTYYVSKITAHRATLVQYGAAGHEFNTGSSAPWTFDSATSGYVQIQNA